MHHVSQFDIERQTVRVMHRWNEYRTETIRRWAVGFQTPCGTFDRLDEAIALCNRCDFLPSLCVQPVAIAESESGYHIFDGSSEGGE